MGLEEEGFDATVLCRFRRRLLECGLERALFERLVVAAREVGLITKDAAQLIDSSHVLGAAGARDTYTLIRGGIRKLLRSLDTPRRARAGSPIGFGGTWTPRHPRSPRSTGARRRLAPPISRRSSEMGGRRFRWRRCHDHSRDQRGRRAA